MEQKDEAMDCLSKKLDFNDLNSTTTGWKELHHSGKLFFFLLINHSTVK